MDRWLSVSVWIIVVSAVLLLLLLVGSLRIGSKLERRRRSNTVRTRLRRARKAELRASELLERCGYEVIGTQVEQQWPILLDDDHSCITLRADYVVRRGGKQFVADAKSGKLASSLTHGPTRRQLLEYFLAYGCDGVLLLDMEQECIREVRFPGLESNQPQSAAGAWGLFILGCVVGMCCTIVYYL